jgi:hypothetical protein
MLIASLTIVQALCGISSSARDPPCLTSDPTAFIPLMD